MNYTSGELAAGERAMVFLFTLPQGFFYGDLNVCFYMQDLRLGREL